MSEQAQMEPPQDWVVSIRSDGGIKINNRGFIVIMTADGWTDLARTQFMPQDQSAAALPAQGEGGDDMRGKPSLGEQSPSETRRVPSDVNAGERAQTTVAPSIPLPASAAAGPNTPGRRDALIARLREWQSDSLGDPLSVEMYALKEEAAAALEEAEREIAESLRLRLDLAQRNAVLWERAEADKARAERLEKALNGVIRDTVKDDCFCDHERQFYCSSCAARAVLAAEQKAKP